MGTKEKLIQKVLYAPVHSVSFRDVQYFLVRVYCMDERIVGDHFIYRKSGIPDIINIQPGRGGMAKPYQLRQIRELVKRYGGV